MIELAIAVVIGAAFGDVIKSLVNHVIMPIVNYARTGVQSATASASQPVLDYTTWQLGQIKIGAFLGDLVNFLIIAAVVFAVIVKLLGTIMKSGKPAAPSEPATKECPMCLSVIPRKARASAPTARPTWLTWLPRHRARRAGPGCFADIS